MYGLVSGLESRKVSLCKCFANAGSVSRGLEVQSMTLLGTALHP